MALKLFRRKSNKAAPVAVPEKVQPVVEAVKKVVEDKLPEDSVKVERVAVPPVDKQETIEEEGDVATVETAADEPVTEEVVDGETKEITSEESTKENGSSPFACCQGSPADVMKSLQAAVGMA